MRNWTILLTALAWMSVATLGPAAFAEKLEDRGVTLAVETELLIEDAVPSHKIDVATEHGIVTMSGSVDNYSAKLMAEETAESVKGVLAVVNNIDVQPIFRPDDQIRQDVIASLASDPVAESYEVDVEVDDRMVTLTGKVDSYTEKRVAERIAQRVKGVRSVNNNLAYDFSDRSDVDIQADIRRRLRSDASIDAGLVTVEVSDGTVTLDGSVASAAERSEAVSHAWIVPGTRMVEDELAIKWWLDGGTADRRTAWTDANKEQAIQTALLWNPRVEIDDIRISVEDGVATLTGSVDHLAAKQAAAHEAEDILGVWRVMNFLRVRPDVARTDVAIAGDIREALRRDPYTDRYKISVDVFDGKAYLKGEVDSWFMRQQAAEVASNVAGVVDLQNNLEVDSTFTTKTDTEIEQDIESQLFWSPFVDSDDVHVDVHAGVATLTGTVEDWQELNAAKENAREGGATSVISKLQTQNGYSSG